MRGKIRCDSKEEKRRREVVGRRRMHTDACARTTSEGNHERGVNRRVHSLIPSRRFETIGTNEVLRVPGQEGKEKEWEKEDKKEERPKFNKDKKGE